MDLLTNDFMFLKKCEEISHYILQENLCPDFYSASFIKLRGSKYPKSLIIYLMPPPSPSPPASAHCYLLLDASSAPV